MPDTASVCDRRLDGELGADPSQATLQTEPYYRCAKCRLYTVYYHLNFNLIIRACARITSFKFAWVSCRRPLFTQSSVLTHMEGQGQDAFTWRNKVQEVTQTQTCRQSLFIEPVQWMEKDVLLMAGKVSSVLSDGGQGSVQ